MEQNYEFMSDNPAVQAAAGEIAADGADGLSEAVQTPQSSYDPHPGFWKDQWRRFKKHRKLLIFLLPAIIITFVFGYIPMLGILIAFKTPAEFDLSKADLIWNITHGGWTFENFLGIFTDDKFGLAIGNTLLINVIRLVLCFPLSILIAVQLSELKSQNLAKIILIIISIPNFLSWTIVIGIWKGFLDPDIGLLGKVFGEFILKDPTWFKPLVVFFSAWKSAGWGCILYYSAIMAIDKTYYESATLEGANRLQKMWYLTIPAILPTIALTLVLNISGMMATGFELVWTMMQISPGDLRNSQIVLDTYIYDLSIASASVSASSGISPYPFSTALSVFNGLIGLILMVGGNYLTSKTLHRGLW